MQGQDPSSAWDPSPKVPCPGADAGIRSPGPSLPRCHRTCSIPGDAQTPLPALPCPHSSLSPSHLAHSSCSLVPRAGREGGCCQPLAGTEAGRGWAAACWGLSPFLGSGERQGGCKGHKAAEPHGHSHSHPGGQPSQPGGPGPGAVGEVFSMDLQEEGIEDGAGPGAGEQLG